MKPRRTPFRRFAATMATYAARVLHSVATRSLTPGAAARVASCHRTTILRAIVRGELKAVRLGYSGSYLIARTAAALVATLV